MSTNINSEGFQYENKPIQLIKFDKQSFLLNKKAMDMLKSIKEEIIVISVVGKARTGKSFLMNTLLELNGSEEGFEVESSINSCTKGIWIWGNFKRKDGSTAKIIFIDSEGTSSIDRSTKTSDSKIFALVILISSLMLYNTTSNIDEQGISELSLAAHISNSIATDSNLNSDDPKYKDSVISELAPKFIWVIRDFSLEKTHPDTGEIISSKEYLELCLNKKISGKNSHENNLIRENIIKYFHDRDCVTLSRPVDSEEELKRLTQIAFSSLNSEFKTETMKLKNLIYKNTQSKRFKGKRLTGEALSWLIENFVQTINDGKVPNINNAWENVVTSDIEQHFEKAKKYLKDKEQSLIDEIKHEEVAAFETKKINDKLDFKHVISKLFQIKKESILIYTQFKLNNRDTLSFNEEYSKLYYSKKKVIEEENFLLSKKIISSLDSFTERWNEKVIREESKEIEKAVNNKLFDEKNYLDFFDLEDKLLNNCKSFLLGRNAEEIFCKSFSNLLFRVFDSIFANIKIKQGKKDSENKVALAELDFQIDSENSKINNLKETLESLDNRIDNKKKDLLNNDKEITSIEERMQDLEERIKIKKMAKEAKLKAIKEQERQEEEREKAKLIAQAEKKKAEEQNNSEEDPARINHRQRVNNKKGNCQCCFIF